MADDDNKLPALRRDNLPAATPHEPPPKRTVVGHWLRGQVGRLNARSFRNSQEEVDALRDLERAKADLADAKTEAERRIARYVYDRDKLIDDDREQTDHELELNRTRRQQELAAARARAQGALDDQVRATYTREFSEAIGPLKVKRGKELFEAGNYLAADALREAKLQFEGGPAPVASPADAGSAIEGMEAAKALLLDQLHKAEARGQDTTSLEMAIGRLVAQIEAAKNQPG